MKNYLGGLVTLTAADAGRNPLTLADLTSNTGWTNPNISGVRLRFSHQFICPTETGRNFTLLDAAVQQARKYNKRLRLCVAAGYMTAQWVYGQGITKYSNADGKGSQPLPWDPAWQTLWGSFIDELAGRVVPGGTLSLEKDPLIAAIVPCGFSTEAGMYFADATDVPRLPHTGYPDVYTAYIEGTKKILMRYGTTWATTPMEITYVAPFNTSEGQTAGKTVKDWFITAYPKRAGTMVSSVFANAQAGAPVRATYPHSGQQFLQCYGNSDPSGLYQKGTPVPCPIPAAQDIFIDMVDNALANGMYCLETYQGDAVNLPATTLAMQAARLKGNMPL